MAFPARSDRSFEWRLIKVRFYDDQTADKVASEFFRYYYHDRGKMKWSGFFLSEHTAALHKQRKQQNSQS